MPANKHLAVTEDTKEDVESLSRKLAVRYDRSFTQDATILWLLRHAPNPEEVDNGANGLGEEVNEA